MLGSGTNVPRARRATSCYLVVHEERALLIDLGPGALHRAAVAGHDLDALDAVLVTHVHPDHCADLVALQFALTNPGPRAERAALPVFAHPEVLLLAARLRNAWPRWLDPGPERLALTAVGPGTVDVPAPWRVEAFPVAHHKSSLGYRVTLPGGEVLAFSGDASEGAELEALGAGADLFVLEAAAPDEQPMAGHLTPRRAAAVAARCGARALLLTHFYPATDEVPVAARARESFEGELILAEDGQILDLARIAAR